MIPLQLKIEPLPIVEPLVARLVLSPKAGDPSDAVLVAQRAGTADFDVGGFSLRVHTQDPASLDGDVVLAIPGRRTIHRLIRASSAHNTFLVTEQCDQLCVMCSQPPKRYHTDMFDQFLEAVRLAPSKATIGLSGGEPLLHKERLFGFLTNAQRIRPDLRFHILTNGQHIFAEDEASLHALDMSSILWGIPIYAAHAEVHDRIVGKIGAFDLLQNNLARLGRVGAAIELRTVVLQSNIGHLEQLADHVTLHQPFAQVWAIMQLENIGYARMNWDAEFSDTSKNFDDIALALDISLGRGLPTSLYNFPLCTVPDNYRRYCVASISDWKQKFLATCDGCAIRSACTGFFEWYPEKRGFRKIVSQ
ncbi:His-Xaa-Ser system radical SAM maturase HxsC [Jannaschia sp. M317]|uniref:His-Xaa-Ser system radical SAM maturase HxsC n=1 Tax=Jannaschia sp. M317 TaxID=2867011 RepID=UPI0021A5B06A|nr:His-Xaa-Ser system radical SAM maturase HxsC [Jannaschia sp. M317]UWQ19277.1 His-Xaa-Ser system radical SAM maturase HxsC [Jannaschia sp. M317]